MKIVAVEPILYFNWLVVRVRTDAGISGVGQTAYWGWPDALLPMIKTFGELLEGEDPMRIEHHWARMHRLKPFRGGAMSGAVAAIDIALWDIAGQALEVPVHQLLGGRQRDRIRLHILINDGQSVEHLVSEARRHVEQGFTALKFDAFPSGLPEDATYSAALGAAVERVAAVREAVGWDVDLITEVWRSLGPGEVIALCRELEPFRLLFVEDPLPPDSEDSMGMIARQIAIPIGGGERNHTLHEFRELLTKDAVQFVRPDVGLAGGLSQTRKIAALAEAFHAQVSAHNFFSPLLTATTAHLYAAIPNAAPMEYLEWDEQEPRNGQLLDPLVRDGGYLEIPEGPGLGVSLDESMIERVPYRSWEAASTPRLRPDGSVYYRG